MISILIFLAPLQHTVIPIYHEAVQQWLAIKPLYVNSGMYYFPQFVFIFMPFDLLPVPLGDIIWCIFSTALFVWGLWRIITLAYPQKDKLLFYYATLIALTPSLGAVRNGQANVIFAAFAVHSAVCLARSQWWVASLCLLGAFFIKPIGLVMLLLAVLVYRPLIWRLCLGLLIFLVLPFLFTDPSYVLSQYQQAIKRLFAASLVTEHRFADLNGLLRTLGIGLTGSVSQIIRIIAGLITAIIWFIGAQQLREPQRACLFQGLATTYLMLFNPMTEVNSYVIVAPFLALYAIRFLIIEGRPVLGWGLIFMGLSIGLFPEIFRSVDRNFGLWWSPIMMLIFGAILIYSVLSMNYRKQITSIRN